MNRLSRRHWLRNALALAPASAAIDARSQAPTASLEAASTASVDIQPIVNAALAAVRTATVRAGECSRYIGPLAAQRPDGSKPRAYGSVAAACILYSTGHFPRAAAEREAFVRYLAGGQSAETGLFADASHSAVHATAYVLSALELFDAGPRFPLTELLPLLAPGGIEKLLDGLDWHKPWAASHAGAGAFAALHLAGHASVALHDRYFGWLAREQDPATGLWRAGALQATAGGPGAPRFDAVAAAFHYLFNHDALRRPIPRPQAIVDTALEVRRQNLHPSLGRGPGFAELDWLYCLTRCVRQSGHRHAEAMGELRSFALTYARNLIGLVNSSPTPFQDLHALNGTMGALAELQQTLPGLLRTERPLKLTLDRRPFI